MTDTERAKRIDELVAELAYLRAGVEKVKPHGK